MGDTDDVERVVLVQKLQPDRVEEYLRAHEDVPDPVTRRMAESGVDPDTGEFPALGEIWTFEADG